MQAQRQRKVGTRPLDYRDVFYMKKNMAAAIFDWGKGTEKTSKEIDDILYLRK